MVAVFLSQEKSRSKHHFPYHLIHCICTFRCTVLFYSYDHEIVFIQTCILFHVHGYSHFFSGLQHACASEKSETWWAIHYYLLLGRFSNDNATLNKNNKCLFLNLQLCNWSWQFLRLPYSSVTFIALSLLNLNILQKIVAVRTCVVHEHGSSKQAPSFVP